jgi:hypothetical protein
MTTGTSVANSVADNGDEVDWQTDPRYLLVQRILASPDFVRSPQLAKFLLYICNATLEGRAHSLSEQHIGVAVFGREPDYDSSADTIVRSHALRLRQRLELYFQRAGREEPIHLIVPRGAYVPAFLASPKSLSTRPDNAAPDSNKSSMDGALAAAATGPSASFARSTDAATLAERNPSRQTASLHPPLSDSPYPSPPPDVIAPRTFSTRSYHVVIASLVVLLIVVTVALGLQLRSHVRANRHHPLWGRLFTDDQPTHIVLGDSGLVLFHAFTQQHVSLQDYLSNDFSNQMRFVQHIEPKYADFLLHRRYTSMVDATAVAHLLGLPEALPERTLVHYSRDIHLNDFKSGNVIMIGAQEAVPWVELFEAHMDFVLSTDNPDKHTAFLDRHPRAGEFTEYSAATPASGPMVYAVMAFLPNLSGNGNVLLLEGLSMAGTEAAVDLALDDRRLLPILSRIRKPDGSLPHFEMLLQSDMLGESAGPARIIAVHLHD